MDIAFFLVPGSLLLVLIFLVLYIWSARDGQYDDLETPKWRLLFDERPESRIDHSTFNSKNDRSF